MEIETSSKEISLQLLEGTNKLFVSTDKDCQGIYEETFYIDKSYHIFPNPVTDALSVVVSDKLYNSTVSVYSVVGQLVYQQLIVQSQNKITVSNLDKGIYLIMFEKNNKQLAVSKFVVK